MSDRAALFRRLGIPLILALGLLQVPAGCGRPDVAPPPKSVGPQETNGAAPAPTGQNPTALKPEALVESFVDEVPGSLVEFTMVLVPGDESRGIAPFYLGKHEVSWDEFAYWALCEDISDKKAIVEREKELRPSTPHDTDHLFRGWGRANQPALGMSRLSAQLYCDWLSEQTGKTYRLPTEAEWEYAFEKGGLKLDEVLDADRLAEIAWYAENTFDDEQTFDSRAMPFGSLEPNKLGIHDMLGNVSEWVTDTDDQTVARGGNFRTPAAELSGKHQEVEDQSIWNKNYPQTPKSKWGYVDADFPGFRLVCEP